MTLTFTMNVFIYSFAYSCFFHSTKASVFRRIQSAGAPRQNNFSHGTVSPRDHDTVHRKNCLHTGVRNSRALTSRHHASDGNPIPVFEALCPCVIHSCQHGLNKMRDVLLISLSFPWNLPHQHLEEPERGACPISLTFSERFFEQNVSYSEKYCDFQRFLTYFLIKRS